MTRPSYRYQRTIDRPAEVEGVGYITGSRIRLRFVPAPANTGVVFVRTDLGPRALLPAQADRVTGTNRRTTLGAPPLTVTVVEHVLAALAGLRIDNCYLELNGPELPGMDGSARAFVEAIIEAGAILQPARRPVLSVDRPILVEAKGGTLAIHPEVGDGLRVSYTLDYGLDSPIGRQTHSVVVTPQSFVNEIACCRTFLLEREARELRRNGIGVNTTAKDLVVFGPRGPIENKLRFANEPARHKVLDVIGDLSLLGCDLRGHVVAYRSGHSHNVDLVRAVMARQGQSNLGQRLAA